MMAGNNLKRRKYIVDWGYQGKFILTIVFISAVGLIANLAAFNYLSYRQLDSVLWSIHIDADSLAVLLRPSLIYSTAFSLLITTAILGAFFVLIMYKTAVPIFRMKRHLEDATAGNLTSRLEWMPYYEFDGVAGDINKMVLSLRGNFATIKNKAGEIGTNISGLGYCFEKKDICRKKIQLLGDDIRALKSELASRGSAQG